MDYLIGVAVGALIVLLGVSTGVSLGNGKKDK